MTKRVPPVNSFTTEDGNPDDKRPRHDGHPDLSSSSPTSSSGRNSLTSNPMIPISRSSGSLQSSSNGNFYTNGSNGISSEAGSVRLFPDHAVPTNNSFPSSFQSSKCSICLWPIGSSRCYHSLHMLSTRTSQTNNY